MMALNNRTTIRRQDRRLFDAHLHIIDPRFSLVANRGYRSDAFTGGHFCLVEGGVKVKATGFGRVQFNFAESLQEIAAVDPSALMFGTDLPDTRARRSFEAADLDLTAEALGRALARRVLHDNAENWYASA